MIFHFGHQGKPDGGEEPEPAKESSNKKRSRSKLDEVNQIPLYKMVRVFERVGDKQWISERDIYKYMQYTHYRETERET